MAHKIVLFFLLILLSHTCESQYQECPPSSCGEILNITYPFRLKTDPKKCGQNEFSLSCENNLTILNLFDGKYIVKSIDYANKTIRITDPDLRRDDCTSLPRRSLSSYNFPYGNPYQLYRIETDTYKRIELAKSAIFMSCENPVNSLLYVDMSSCSKRNYSYVVLNGSLSVRDMASSCRIELMALVSQNFNISRENVSYLDIHSAIVDGIELAWTPAYRRTPSDPWDALKDVLSLITHRAFIEFIMIVIAMGLGARFILASPFVITFFIYIWRRRHLSMYSRIEEFLQNYNNLIPIRYSYSDIKKMTKAFEHKLGEGGYGSVYKGKLRSGRHVAIKILGTSKHNVGEDFINEVATIGRIHHVNVVQLIGFCVEGKRRALVYDFMPNGSLDKHIFPEKGNMIGSLNSGKMFEIALGVARGIKYLHRGCEIQILHFDIKPHNILLDENFVPKVSDFGLARLCPLENNTVSLTAARGTLGYIAPELFYKNIGGVSYKADVYSFGMLLMEMASRRKNLNSSAENSSKVHFPSWVSSQFSEGNDIDLGFGTEEDLKVIKKMMIVALWCIQFKPCDRPSMSKVVEMLEEKLERLEMPPTKFTFYQKEELSEDTGDSSSSMTWSLSYQSEDSSMETSLLN